MLMQVLLFICHQFVSLTLFVMCSSVHDRGVSFRLLTGCVITIVKCLGQVVGSLSLCYLLPSSQLMSNTSFQTSLKVREWGVSFWPLDKMVEAFANSNLCSPSWGCQVKTITVSAIIWEQGGVSLWLLIMWVIVNINSIAESASVFPICYLSSRRQPRSITCFRQAHKYLIQDFLSGFCKCGEWRFFTLFVIADQI